MLYEKLNKFMFCFCIKAQIIQIMAFRDQICKMFIHLKLPEVKSNYNLEMLMHVHKTLALFLY